MSKFILLLLLISTFSVFVVAQESPESCVDSCKSTCYDEECRSKCITQCKERLDFDDQDFDYTGGKDDKYFDDKDSRHFDDKKRNDRKGDFYNDDYDDDRFIDNRNGTCGDFDCDEIFDDIKEEYGDEKITGAGITPDSFFYFLDGFFDSREEKISEIKAMIEAGDIESARKAKAKYLEYTKKLEKEADPKEREKIRKGAAAIYNALKDIEGLSEENRKEFVQDILEEEGGVVTAVEISNKIKDLCIQLAEIDPMEYSRMCNTDDDAPKWKKKLHKDLTKDQQKIAKDFVKVMKQCFKTSGQECECEKIPFPDFADACSQAAPLAVACDIENNERACEKLDNLEMPELPDFLQEIFDELEGEMNEEQYRMHMPKECVEAGVTNPKECGEIMIRTNAPKECKQPLLDSGCDSERDCREICDKIMMEIHSPECVEEGITDPRECAEKMMPPECKGLSPRECEDKMGGRRHGPRIDFDCKKIQDPTERLECYDKASSQAKGFGGFDDDYKGNCMTDSDWKAKKQECRDKFGQHAGDEPIYGDSGEGWECVIDAKCVDFSQGKLDFEEIKEKERECANTCESKGGAWDFSYGDCKCYFDDYKNKPDIYEGCGAIDCDRGYHCEYGKCISDSSPGENYQSSCDDCASKCPGSSGTDCVNGRCECYYDDSPQYAPGEGPGEPGDYDNPDYPNPEEPQSPGGSDGGSSDSSSSDSSDSSSGSDSSGSDSSNTEGSDSSSSGSSDSGGGDGGSDSPDTGTITGDVIFWDYITR